MGIWSCLATQKRRGFQEEFGAAGQDKRREKNKSQLISKSPEEVSLNNLELLR